MKSTNNPLKFIKVDLVPISVLEINYLDDGNYPFKLVHTSPSFTNTNIDRLSAVFVYEVNKNYSP